jgi:hypothetical protein
MSRIKLSKFLGKVNYDKCLNSSVNNNSLINQFATNTRDRSSLQSGCDNINKKKYSKIFKDLNDSIRKIETEKFIEQGVILTNKLEGTTTSTRNHENNIEMNNEIDQSGSGRKRKYVHHKKKIASESGHHSRKKKRKTVRKKHHHVKKRKTTKHKKRGVVKKSSKKRKTKHHFRRHNIFSRSD